MVSVIPKNHLCAQDLAVGNLGGDREADTHMRKVLVGIDGSSVFATAARTSGYGESSSMSLHARRESAMSAWQEHDRI